MLKNVTVLCHSSIKINKEKVIYIDPYNIDDYYKDADIIFITHEHYDHYSKNDIDKIKKDNTKIIIPYKMFEKLINDGFEENNIIKVLPNKKYVVENIEFETLISYNVNKNFHPKENDWLGYVININNNKYYIAGDTDITEENQKVKCDVAFIPIGGTFTMDYKEAAILTNKINPKIVVPIHYGSIVGTKEDALKFSKLLNKEIECKIFIN